jgi:multimeric flavodoxin WrbA
MSPIRKIRTIAFCGSPRKNGNTEILMKEAIRGVESKGIDVEIFYLNTMKIRACQNCGGCDETGECIIKDDMAPIYDAVRKADRLILASPIYFFSLSAQVKVMIDRFQSFWCEKYLLNRPIDTGKYGRKALLLLAGGMKKETGVQCSEACARAFFRTVSISEHETLSFLGIDDKGDIMRHPTAMNDAFEAGKRLVDI